MARRSRLFAARCGQDEGDLSTDAANRRKRIITGIGQENEVAQNEINERPVVFARFAQCGRRKLYSSFLLLAGERLLSSENFSSYEC
ncbi:MAG: hypothetical protein K1X75_16090, partial [Leptospirales bacterium]|nr:hypothetical protein [Leptospirales bacterium]